MLNGLWLPAPLTTISHPASRFSAWSAATRRQKKSPPWSPSCWRARPATRLPARLVRPHLLGL